jgi:hypothetical protein
MLKRQAGAAEVGDSFTSPRERSRIQKQSVMPPKPSGNGADIRIGQVVVIDRDGECETYVVTELVEFP